MHLNAYGLGQLLEAFDLPHPTPSRVFNPEEDTLQVCLVGEGGHEVIDRVGVSEPCRIGGGKGQVALKGVRVSPRILLTSQRWWKPLFAFALLFFSCPTCCATRRGCPYRKDAIVAQQFQQQFVAGL